MRNGRSDAVPSGLTDPATIGVAVATGAYLSVFATITDIVGGTARVTVVVTLAAIAGIVIARTVGERTAIRVAAVLLLVGLGGYYFSVPESQRALFSVRSVGLDMVSLLTGLSVLRLTLADVWVLAVAPVPTFLVAYLTGRGRHVIASAVAGVTLGFLVLTGDASGSATLAGVVGVALASGLSTLSAVGGLRARSDVLAIVVALMIVASMTITVIPAGAGEPWGAHRGTPGLESTLVDEDELEIIGSTRLSPAVRFTMESEVERNWHTGSYDTYTGDGWVRSGDPEPVEGPLDGPPGDAMTVESTFTAETDLPAIPAPWQAVAVDGPVSEGVRVDEHGTLRPGTPVLEDDRVTVESRVVDADPDELRAAGDEYDDRIEERYTQLPESTPDRLGERTEEIVDASDAETPYDQAVVIEEYLVSEYDYSLTIERPEGDVADAFLFEMDAGYCTYFATTMVVMLRSQGIPARFATGYSSGERVANDEWVVRGQDAHAWVMVYVPDHGWIEFDPTPSADREQARDTRLAEARANGDEGVDVDATVPEGGPADRGELTLDQALAEPNDDPAVSTAPADNDTNATDVDEADDINESLEGVPGVEGPRAGGTSRIDESEIPVRANEDEDSLPLRETFGYWLLAFIATVAGAHHVGATSRAHRVVRLRLPKRRNTPRAEIEQAFADLEHLLARRHRARRPGETPREYLDALRLRGVDERVHAVGKAYERATYAGEANRSEAAAARRTVRRLALESTPVIGRLFDSDRE